MLEMLGVLVPRLEEEVLDESPGNNYRAPISTNQV